MSEGVARPTDSRYPSSPTVTWFELFYDLVVVAAVSLTNDAFLAEPSIQTAGAAALGIIALSWVWFLTTLFNNMFPGRDLVRRLLLLIQMALIIVAALAISRVPGDGNRIGLLAYAGALAVVALLIATDRLVRGAPRQGTSVGAASIVSLLLAAGLCVAGSLLRPEDARLFLAAALVVSIVPTLTWQYKRWIGDSRLRMDHLRERLGLFILIILGEGFAQLVAALHSLETIPRTDLFALMFIVSFALWWIYFDGTFSEHLELGRVRWRLSLLGHLTLVFGMAGTLDILVLAAAQEEEAKFGPVVTAYFATSIAIVLFSFTLLRYTAKGRIGRTGVLHAVSGLVILVIGFTLYLEDAPSTAWFIGLCAALIIVNGLVSAWVDRESRRGGLGSQFVAVLRGGDAPDKGL